MKRNLDGCYFGVKRDGEWQPICFSDLTEKERDELFENKEERSVLWWKSLAYHLADCLKKLGDDLDVMRVEED